MLQIICFALEFTDYEIKTIIYPITTILCSVSRYCGLQAYRNPPLVFKTDSITSS